MVELTRNSAGTDLDIYHVTLLSSASFAFPSFKVQSSVPHPSSFNPHDGRN